MTTQQCITETRFIPTGDDLHRLLKCAHGHKRQAFVAIIGGSGVVVTVDMSMADLKNFARATRGEDVRVDLKIDTYPDDSFGYRTLETYTVYGYQGGAV